MPKRRILKNILAGCSLLALGAGLHSGWTHVNSQPGGAWAHAAQTWARWSVTKPASGHAAGRQDHTPVASIPPSKSPPTAASSKELATARLAQAGGAADAPSPISPEATATSAKIFPPSLPAPAPAGKTAVQAAPGNQPATALAAITAAIAPISAIPAAKAGRAPLPDLDQAMLAAYAPLPDMQLEADKRQGKAQPMPVDITGMRDALAAYKSGDLEKGDSIAKTATNATARLALEWAALRLQARPAGFNRIEAFLNKNPEWPMADWLRARAEQAMYVDNVSTQKITNWFAANQPSSPAGHMLAARRLLAEGKKAEAAAIISRLWREDDLGLWAEGALQKEFAELLTAADHRWRSDRFFYKEKYPASIAAAGKAGKDFLAFANARTLVARGADPAKAGEKIDAKLRDDPTWHFARITRLRKAQKYDEAAALLLAAPADPATIVDANEWWEERRIVARKRLDAGDAESAYKIAANHGAAAGEALISAEFHAGWIALRFLNKAEESLAHFARAGEASTTPMSRSRSAYWHARAAERGPDPQDADRLYALAAQYSSSYYGQLAMERLGRKETPIRKAADVAEGDARLPAIRVVELLEAMDEKELAFPLAVGMGRTLSDRPQLAALAQVLAKSKHARATLVVGKLASQRGVELDDIAFPVYGIPEFAALANSATKPMVYAIARQESAFQANVVSTAGAKGLMQMLTSTAARTAKNKKVPFDANRLLNDPAFNAQLGAAHLGELMDEHPGSLLMVFAAYNAGGHRVKQWIQAYGDPRKPGVDPIDWVERIPFTETRNYVQRVAENLAVYRALLKENNLPSMAEKELRAYAARM